MNEPNDRHLQGFRSAASGRERQGDQGNEKKATTHHAATLPTPPPGSISGDVHNRRDPEKYQVRGGLGSTWSADCAP